eukprot:gnl/Hemi2/1341_TR474_c0_g1_i1.p1 gnl/Hemi2/1341_TR474_c0_g1~~gnl/Hemi2/1341_TR474_c0_g1_i1.p1  ORF type:complete len:111 (+),score=42.38 gnl/Hemi2/1341_TR474_c0_g1_i1:55-387(+)
MQPPSAESEFDFYGVPPPAATPPPTLSAEMEAIKQQIEFYFSESNLLRDKFLQAQSRLNPEGYVSIAVIASFRRMQQLGADVAKIAEAVADSTAVELSADKTMVRGRAKN